MAEFVERIKALIRFRKEREEAAKAIASSQAEVGAGEEVDYEDMHEKMDDMLATKQGKSGMTYRMVTGV